MAAPVLTVAEQKVALSKRKKKRILKNVLSLPKSFKVESQIIAFSEAEKLKHILERLLPSARLPNQQNFKWKNAPEETALKEAARFKRKQLSLGVNDLNKTIKSGLISAALLASDIEPKLLVQHLNLLCFQKKIPHLDVVGLREITKKCLGFPCIALGFKNTFDFAEAVNEIKSLSLKKSETCQKIVINMATVTQENEKEEEEANAQNQEPPFSYLYRSSSKERIFDPENLNSNEKTNGFIPVDKCAKVSGISSCLVKKENKKLKVKEDSGSEENFVIPRKKPKKDWLIDRIGSNEKLRYYSVNLVKVSSNPNRIGGKRKN